MAESPQKRPLSPQQLFERLLTGNFKQSECEDESKKMQEEREILISLIAEYQAEINKRIADQLELENLLQIRAKLRAQLQCTREQRKSIDENIANQITHFKLTPVEIRQQGSWKCQVEEIRAKNARMGIRIRQLLDYCTKMENYNLMLEKENHVIRQIKAHPISEAIEVQDWRSKFNAIRKEHEAYSLQLRNRIREKEEKSLRELQQQECEIAQRNRQRMNSFQERHRRYFY